MELGKDQKIKEYFESSFIPDHPPLTNKQTEECIKQKLVFFPEIIRKIRDKSTNDKYVLASFLIGEKYPLIVVRDIGTKSEIKEIAKNVVENIDSKSKIVIFEVNKWVPVIDNPEMYSEENEKIIDKELMKEHEMECKTMMKEKQIMEMKTWNDKELELNERVKILMNSINAEEKIDMDYFIRKKICLIENDKQLRYLRAKADLLEKRSCFLSKILLFLKNDFEKDWFQTYSKKVKEVGIKTDLDPALIFELQKSEYLGEKIEVLLSQLKESEIRYGNLKYSDV
jgi:hypothetical protein